MSKNCIRTKNYAGIWTVFTEEQRNLKSPKHPELREDAFIERVKKTIEKPDFIYEDLSQKYRSVYYIRDYGINAKIRYTKVILRESKSLCFVVTAYRPDYVKEKGKTKLIYGKHNE